MRGFFDWIDETAGIDGENKIAVLLERIAFIFLVLMILAAPHSIAVTQTAWLLGTVVWLVRFLVNPRPRFIRTPLDAALWIFFGWTVLTSIFSYAPDISINKLRGALLFLIFYFVVNNIRTVRAVKLLAFALLFSCLASVVWAPVQRIYGRGVEIHGVAAESVFNKSAHFDHDTYLATKGKNLRRLDTFGEQEPRVVTDGGTIVEVDGEKIRTPDEIVAEIEKNETAYVECFDRREYFTIKVRRADLLPGATALEKLGVGDWKHNRNWRYSGFYSQVVTYAEVLQMITLLALGLFIALGKKRSTTGALLTLCLVGMAFALLLTFTRATQVACLAAAAAMVLAYGGSRRMLFTLAAIGLPLVLLGIFLFQQTRQINIYNQADKSINYRETVYREGFDLWTRDARNLLLGVGMDSTKRYAAEWRLFDDGRLPVSHFHSTPLQLLVERGLPALLLWLWVLWVYGRMLVNQLRMTNYELREKSLRFENRNPQTGNLIEDSKFKIQNPKPTDWQLHGILLGCFGALVGFFGSSLVNYSLGDGEVVMVFYILMGIGVGTVIVKRQS